jgi:hypothetical protein
MQADELQTVVRAVRLGTCVLIVPFRVPIAQATREVILGHHIPYRSASDLDHDHAISHDRSIGGQKDGLTLDVPFKLQYQRKAGIAYMRTRQCFIKEIPRLDSAKIIG